MASTPQFTPIDDAAKALEHALLESSGPDIRIRVHAERYVPELVRDRNSDAEVIHRLDDCDLKLWTVHRPEGAFTLGLPFSQVSPACSLSGQTIDDPAPLGIYFRGRPVAPEAAFRGAPLLVYLWALAVAVENQIVRVGVGGTWRQRAAIWRQLIELIVSKPPRGGIP